MTGLERNLKYWFLYVGKSLGLIYLMIIGIVAVTSLLDGDNFMDRFSSNIAIYLTMASAMSVIVFGFTNITVMFPVTVSMSSRRSSSLIGMNVAQQVLCLLSFVVSFLCALYQWPILGEMLSLVIPVGLGLVGVLFFLGNIVAFLSERFGRTVGMILYIVFVMAITFAVVLGAGMIGNDTFMAAAANINAIAILICAGGILLDVVGIWILAAGINKKEIQFC
ncbi:MAG: hypothetical protein J5626_01235 [Lachnospiraceae bacterium]|nr:hypothetical protein [Lachnospiraceae bacterium]